MLIAGIGAYFLPTITGWFALNDVVHYVFYLLFGMVCAKWCKFINEKWMIAGIFAFVLSIVLFILFPHKRIIKFIISLLMVLAVWIFALLLNNKWKVNRDAAYAQTYPIFILSWPCQLVVEIVFERLFKLPFAVVFPAMLVTGLTVPLIIILVIDILERKTKTTIISKIIGR